MNPVNATNTALTTAATMTSSLLEQFEELVVFMRDTNLGTLVIDAHIPQAIVNVQQLQKSIAEQLEGNLSTSSHDSSDMARDVAVSTARAHSITDNNNCCATTPHTESLSLARSCM
jgi:hypothetical protein